MKILFINSVVDYGSTGKLVRDIANASKQAGHDVLVAYGRYPQENSEDTFYFGSKISTYWHVLMTRLLGRHGLHSSLETKKLIKVIDEYNPEVIHLHNLHGYYLNVRMLFNYLKTRPQTKILWTLHDCWSFSGSSAYFSYSGCKVWDKGCVECNTTREYPESLGFSNQKYNFNWKKEAFSNINNLTILTPSDWLKQLTEQTFLNSYKIKRIYNGIDLQVFRPLKNESNSTEINLLGVANIWEKRKGLDDFIELSKRLPEDYKITLIGLSKQQCEGLPSSIKGITRTENVSELVEYYSNADIYLNLSQEETMGLTTVEALACGTPVIVYDQTAVPEIVGDEVGLVVKANDIDLLATSIQNFDFVRYSSEACREYSFKFSKEKMIENYLKEIEKL
ncbi:glycosyltransferase [Erysipelothrix sp. HDW6A]|uniref:glycosyltransferase n=1 Tax=Erysipelothrix sp. HDW6A TaxID=2714928 RepID=UPI00140B10AD|nr:glycosyltransferase [Erysipelothrix sp. HDW6A]QIK57522.1 glycosyltransferase [Erysipelothrix sp. HDW6A]